MENQVSTPRVTRAPKNNATTTAGSTAAVANISTNLRCSRAPASLARAPIRRTTLQPTAAARARISTRLASTTANMVLVAGPIGPEPGARIER